MRTYEQVVNKNYEHMKTTASEWRAVPVKEFNETKDKNGKSISMPIFNFPQGYTNAPTLFPSLGQEIVCGLCGHSISIVYWIQNDTKKWILGIGSECVTHFDGKSGEEVVKEVKQEISLALLLEVKQTRKDINHLFSQPFYGYFGTFWEVRSHRAINIYKELAQVRGKVDDDSGKATITRWANSNGDKARRIIEEAKKLINREINSIVGINTLEDLNKTLESIPKTPTNPQDAYEAKRLRAVIDITTRNKK